MYEDFIFDFVILVLKMFKYYYLFLENFMGKCILIILFLLVYFFKKLCFVFNIYNMI